MKILAVEFTKEYIHLFSVDVKRGSACVEKVFHLDMPQNGYSGGMLINNDHSISELIANTLKENKIHDKKVVVSVSSVDCLTEEFSLPKEKKKIMDGMVEQELLKRRRLTAQYLFDYTIMGDDLTKTNFALIRAVLCPKTLVNNYYDVLKKAGLTPICFDLTNHSMEFMTQKSGLSLSQEIYILACINQDEIHFTYCGRNEEPYYRHAFIKQEEMLDESMFVLSANNKFNLGMDPQEKLVDTVIENVTRLTRFHSQRHPEIPISGIRIYGDYKDIPSLCDRIQNTVGIPTQSFNILSSITNLSGRGETRIWGSINVLGTALSIVDNNNNYDFFEKLNKSKDEKGSNLFWLPTILAIVFAAVIICLYSYMNTKNLALQKEIDEVAEFVNNPSMQLTYGMTQDYLDDIDSLISYSDKMQLYVDTISERERFGTDIIELIDKYVTEDVEITALSFQNNEIVLSCISDTKYAPSEFTSKLSTLDEFENVTYSGFQAIETGDGTSYSFSVEIELWKEEDDGNE